MNLIIDGNSFLNVAASIVKTMLLNDKRIGAQYWVDDLLHDNSFLLKESAKREFKTFSLRYLNSITSLFSNLNSVYLVFDSKSWRKNYIRDHFSTSAEDGFDYKGHRKYDSKQYLFYEYFQNDLLQDISAVNIVSIRIPGAEGDDIITRIIERNPSSDFCIWSTDLDFFQLLRATPKIILTTPKMSKKTKNVFTVNGITDQAGPFDILNFSMSDDHNFILELKQKGFQHIIIDPRVELLTKIISGDSSDNIPRVHKQMTAKKVAAIVDEMLDNRINLLGDIDILTNEFIDHLSELICSFLKVTDLEIQASIKNNLKLNTNIIRLNSKFFPIGIVSAIDSMLDKIGVEKFNSVEYKKVLKTLA